MPALATADPATSPIDHAVGYEIFKQVNLPQLQTEISALASTPVTNTALSGPTDPTKSVSEENPLVLWVAPMAISADAVNQAVAAHVPQPNWGIPQVILQFQQVLGMLRDDPEAALDDSDRDALLRGIALHYSLLVSEGG